MSQIFKTSPILTAQIPSPINKRFACQKLLRNGRRCDAVFTRAYALKRHDLDQHDYPSTKFVDCHPGAIRRRTIQLSSSPKPATAVTVPVFLHRWSIAAASTMSPSSQTIQIPPTGSEATPLPLNTYASNHARETNASRSPASNRSSDQIIENESHYGYQQDIWSCREAAHGPLIEVAASNVTNRQEEKTVDGQKRGLLRSSPLRSYAG